MKHLLLIAAFLAVFTAQSQEVAGFENLLDELDTFQNNGGGGFYNGNLFFPNNYNPEYDSWTDWAISSMRDTVTPGYINQYSSYAGGGKVSDAYGVASAYQPVVFRLIELTAGMTINGIYITNSTFTALSMLEGDAFAKKFGGESGDDPDFFLLTIRKWYEGERSVDSINFYLADYRFEDNSQDYIVKDWTYVETRSLGPADSIEFTLNSSDVGAFGMNTPAYFCIDNVLLDIESSTTILGESIDLKIFPNPTSDMLYVNGLEDTSYSAEIYDAAGRLTQQFQKKDNGYDIRTLTNGNYFFVINVDGKRFATSFVKQ
ncbi:DUF4465 domain-containing protein [Portibacter lacus]|uniref:Secretion system C-terminal sorting domain-containing protein n=1 Tax=Portibacter lacus TaxID=1099794 RepID=A0AA37SQ97_9BACT|nr:DUF4465 domain-containing protein [Portibacter lacus]GLR18062.1 hypothetical protein GCM10007940_26770 [Portibacter lacus]